MRKDKKSSYQAKKDKLHYIKYLLKTNMEIYSRISNHIQTQEDIKNYRRMDNLINDIWELVKNEK